MRQFCVISTVSGRDVGEDAPLDRVRLERDSGDEGEAMSRFGDATAVQKAGDGRYLADLDGAFGFGEALNGGYLMAVMLRAAVDASPHEHPVATGANFLKVAKAGPAEVVVEPRRAGRTAASSRVTLLQAGQPVIDMQVTTGTLDPAAEPVWSGTVTRRLPPVGECTSFESRKDEERGFADRVDMRFDPAVMGWLDGKPTGTLEGAAYFRLRPHEDEDQYAPDAYLLALAVDCLPPVVLNTGASGWAPTVELTWHMRAVPVPGWLEVHGSGRLVSDGWFDEEVEIWDSAGRLVAQSRQLARSGHVKK
jgi:acyl-CoA thioesterase